MGYVLKLRQTVGQQPLIVTGAAAVVVDQRRLLLVKRRDNLLWGLPAGSKELNESLTTTAIRELHEETGLTGQSPQLLTVVSGLDMQYRYPNGDQIDSVTVVYRMAARGKLAISNETSEVAYFPLTTLPAELTPITRCILGHIRGLI